jgi:hypothetical protein
MGGSGYASRQSFQSVQPREYKQVEQDKTRFTRVIVEKAKIRREGHISNRFTPSKIDTPSSLSFHPCFIRKFFSAMFSGILNVN